MAAALRRRGHEVDLLYPRLYGAGLSPLWKLAVIPARFADWLRLAWRLRRGDYDAVHIHYAYLGIVDSLHVELIYATPEGYAKRLAALSRVFSDSLSLLQGASRG